MTLDKRRARRVLAPSLAALALFQAVNAQAYCRTTTCDPATECEYDLEGCATVGKPLSWGNACVSFSVQKDGSELRDISFEQAHALSQGAFDKWLSVECAGGLPSIDVEDRSPVSCGRPEYNAGDPNANVIMFRDDDWPYAGANATLALTTITFNFDTGEIFDADIEINSANTPLTTSANATRFDLDSILTHEIGHFLGLSHSADRNSTMYQEYTQRDISLRDLEPDDENGICAIYPRNRPIERNTCEPRHGFSGKCAPSHNGGCTLSGPDRIADDRAREPGGWLGLSLFGLGWLLWARRRSAGA